MDFFLNIEVLKQLEGYKPCSYVQLQILPPAEDDVSENLSGEPRRVFKISFPLPWIFLRDEMIGPYVTMTDLVFHI